MLATSQPNPPADQFTLDRFFDLTQSGAFQLFDLFVGLVLATLLTLAFVQTYKATHRGASYSVAYLQSLFILAACTTLIMVVIGSNIARAFSLVGALSIIRFRTAMKDPRDVGFIFATLAVGMGCGTGFYGAAIIFTIFLNLLILILARLNVGEALSTEAVLRVTFNSTAGASAVEAAESALMRLRANPILVNRVIERSTKEQTISWRIRTGDDASQTQVQQTIQAIDGVDTVAIFALDDFNIL